CRLYRRGLFPFSRLRPANLHDIRTKRSLHSDGRYHTNLVSSRLQDDRCASRCWDCGLDRAEVAYPSATFGQQLIRTPSNHSEILDECHEQREHKSVEGTYS